MPKQDPDELVAEFVTFLKRRSTNTGSYSLAAKCVELLRTLVRVAKWHTASELMEMIREAGKQLQTGRPGEAAVGNMVRRVLRLIREAYAQCVATEDAVETPPQEGTATSVPGLNTLLTSEGPTDFGLSFKSLKSVVITSINDLLEELQESAHNIALQALEHIHSDEVIMTFGHSRTVEAFLRGAAAKRNFTVIVAEGAPYFRGQTLACRLAEAGIETTVITDSAIFAMMSRVNKVIIGTHAVMADGGLMAVSGCHALCMAAKHHSVPVLVCSAMFKLCPRYVVSYDQDTFNSMADPGHMQRYSDGKVVGDVDCVLPLYDFVPPDLITLLISNIGGNAPSYVYRLLSEYYHEDDYEL